MPISSPRSRRPRTLLDLQRPPRLTAPEHTLIFRQWAWESLFNDGRNCDAARGPPMAALYYTIFDPQEQSSTANFTVE